MAQRDIQENAAVGQEDVQSMEDSGQRHRMSIATTIGATIALIGLVIFLYGLLGHADYSRSDGVNINLWWGLLMLIFGIVMSVGGYISSRRQNVS